MQGLFSVLNIALSLAAKSLAETIPYNFDNCIFGFRYIVVFSGKEDRVTLETAEILTPDWELIPEISNKFAQQVDLMVENRNIEFRELIKQSKQIQEDSTF